MTKQKIAAWRLNLQHFNHVAAFPSHSYEQYYQGLLRCWLFGQKRAVTVAIVTTEGECGVMKNMRRKGAQATKMFEALIKHMNDAIALKRSNKLTKPEEIPTWL